MSLPPSKKKVQGYSHTVKLVMGGDMMRLHRKKDRVSHMLFVKGCDVRWDHWKMEGHLQTVDDGVMRYDKTRRWHDSPPIGHETCKI